MDAFEKKTLKTSRGYTYTYYVADGDKSLPTLFFQHGWPDHAAMWKDVAGPLRSTKHPIIIPDMLGYDGTDKPTDPSVYKWNVMTKDMVEILDAEGAEKCISIGHDWGSGAASRFYHYHPDRVAGLVNLNVPYLPPTREPFDLETANKRTKQVFGYSLLAYWHLFTAPDGPEILKGNLERLFNLLHGDGDTMKTYFCGNDEMRNYLTGKTDATINLRPYAKDATFKKTFVDRMSRDGFEGPQCWYKATSQNHQHECDKELPGGIDVVQVPALYIGCKQDAVCRPEAMYESIQKGLLPKLEQAEMIDAAHWSSYEAPQEVVMRLEAWLKKNYK
ncbi:alpha/beta-hydrolase [Clathrospora elynae]|uniref:Alpha/beta-hydrolase n=1 Tax=Clathrospora elynae TaxID=706981 RepID=A0A6A5S6H1_9PLEO|nr:alpha/beta-hydrolase [Clathrospora elynae]